MLNGVLVALIGLIAAIIGGGIQAYATGKFEKSKFIDRQNGRHTLPILLLLVI